MVRWVAAARRVGESSRSHRMACALTNAAPKALNDISVVVRS